MLLPYICPITMLQLRGGRAAVVGERCGGRRQQDVDGRSFDARWASGREVVCGEGLGCGLVGVDARMLQPVARAKRRTGGGGPKTRRHWTRLPGKTWNGRSSCQVSMGGAPEGGERGKKRKKSTRTARKCREKADAEKRRLRSCREWGGCSMGGR